MAIYQRRSGWEVRVYVGVEPVIGKPHLISRQVQGSPKKAEKEEIRLKAQVMKGRHRGTRAMTLADMVGQYLDWREHNGKQRTSHLRATRGPSDFLRASKDPLTAMLTCVSAGPSRPSGAK
jgi:hypothetical protein